MIRRCSDHAKPTLGWWSLLPVCVNAAHHQHHGRTYISAATSGDRCNTFDESWSVSMWRCAVRRLSELEKSEIWDRFEGGESQRSISRRLGRSPSTIRTHLVSAGFGRPVSGPEWSSLRLLLTEREEISRGLAVGESFRCIASGLGRASSTVSREVTANGGRNRCRATTAHKASRHRARRPKLGKLASNHRLREVVEEKLEDWWSPTQISDWLVDEYGDTEEMWVSHETIYQSLFVQGKAHCVRSCGAV